MSIKIDLKGKVLGDFTILEYDPESSKKKQKAMWRCQCNRCGVIKIKYGSKLVTGHGIICQDCHPIPQIDIDAIKGKIYGYLEVIDYDEQASLEQHATMLTCKCTNCGKIRTVEYTQLNYGNISSCGQCEVSNNGPQSITMIGKTFGDITVLSEDIEATNKGANREKCYIGRCSKGHIHTYRGSNLRKIHRCPICSAEERKKK